MKLSTLLFGLLLAVGWTSSASAQALPQSSFAERFTYKPMAAVTPVIAKEGMRDANEPCGATYSASSIKDLKYTWTDASNVTHESPYVVLNETTGKYEAELVTDPYQMYGLLRGVYMEKKLPGPYYSAYKSDGTTREREVYYGGIGGGWDIPGEYGSITYDPLGNITITVTHDYSREWSGGIIFGEWVYTYYPVLIKSIKVMSGSTVVTKYDIDEASGEASTSWTQNGYIGYTESGEFTFVTINGDQVSGIASGGTFTVPASLLTGYHDVQVVIEAYSEDNAYDDGTIAVNGSSKTISYGTTPSTYGGDDWAMHANSTVGGTPTYGDVLIRTTTSNSYINSITITSGNTNIITWNAPTTGTYADLPNGWYSNKRLQRSTGNQGGVYMSDGGVIRIPESYFKANGYRNVTVTVRARRSNNGSGTLYVNYDNASNAGQGGRWTLTTTATNYPTALEFPILYQPDTYKPDEEGYTALMVAIKNNATLFTEPSAWGGAWEFSSKTDVINYLSNTVESIKLLTDGLRIGIADDFSRGTVFNCDGTYDKFYILGKGQARMKSAGVIGGIAAGRWPSYVCEEVPFKFMFEEFSPTTGDKGSEITDFYSEMMKGDVYNVVHDCASVIQQKHQFSLSGNSANPEAFSFTGLNFFIPDYRLKYWKDEYYIKYTDGTQDGPYDVDGRDMNPYQLADENDKTGPAFNSASYWCVNFGQYNQDYAPQIGLYRITLDASAEKSADYNFEDPSKRNYDITLHWVSSLDEMAGHPVDQIYTLYTWDEDGNRIELHPTGVTFLDADGNVLTGDFSDNPFVVTQVTYQWPQQATSQIFEYQVHGTPDDNEHPGFVAWSNTDYVVIPGWNDFLALKRNHYESDFVVNKEKNYYRNFLTVTNENEDNALTVSRIADGENTYTLYRYDVANPNNMDPVADLTFNINGNPATAKYVTFGVTYADGSQDQLRPSDKPLKYNLGEMGVMTSGDLCIHGNGDLIIEPNGTTVNFHSITVSGKRNNTTQTITSWNESMGKTLPQGWLVSPGSVFDLFEDVYYLEGHGYIYIPSTMLTGYTDITVTIEASGDAGSVSRITVNDVMKKIANGVSDDYTWTAEEVAYDIHDEDGMIRMGGLPLVDQFSASTAKNDHPERYGYVLIYKKGTDDEKQSSKVEVPVQHTKASVNGFYTEDAVINDTDRELKTDVIEADVTLNLSATNADIYHYILLSEDKNVVPEVDDARTDYVSYLQQRGDFTYREMNENSPLWVEDNTFGWPAGELQYFNNDNDLTTGGYGDFKTYVPVVETTGYDRRWYEVQNSQYGDHLHNTYGSPIWKTSAGKVANLSADAQPQQGWNTTWKNGDEDCRLYMLDSVKVDGYLPSTEVTNIEYEPYMFRIFVESKNGKLRHFQTVTDENGNDVIAADEGSTTGPWCVWSEYITLDENGDPVDNTANGVTFGTTDDGAIHFEKIKVDRTYPTTEEWTFDEENAIFGAVNALANENELINANDLTVYVRFYYRSTGKAIETGRFMLRADGDQTPEYYAAEGDSQAKQTPTGVSEIRYHGEVVSTTYYNVQGIKSDKPFDGVNIVVTRYSDGTTSVSKVVK